MPLRLVPFGRSAALVPSVTYRRPTERHPMEDLDLYAVGASGRVNLGDLLTGVKFVQAEKQEDGAILVKPVNIRPATGSARKDAVEGDEPFPGV